MAACHRPMDTPAVDGDIPKLSWLERLVRRLLISIYFRSGWRVEGQPDTAREDA